MKRAFLIVTLTVSTFIGLGQHTNVMISSDNNPEEPSIIINPKNPLHQVAASNINNLYHSLDGGYTWSHDTMQSSYGVWGDPCLIVDTAGYYYFFHLANPPSGNWIDRIVCQRATGPSGPWTDGTFMGLNGAKAQDKEWAVVDNATNAIHVTWTQFDKYGSMITTDSSNILYSKSTDQGNTWSAPKRLNKIAGDCRDTYSTVEGAVPAIGPNGEVYVAWAGPEGLLFDRSLDNGNTWLDNDIFVDSFPGGWDYEIPGIYRCNGLPVTKCDLSGGPFHGNIYINWTDQRNGITDTDVWLAKSSDGGNTWSAPLRVNDDPPGKQQFFTWMDVDQVTGYLYFVFYDRRNHSDNTTDVYMAVSKDGGSSFINFKISETPFLPSSNVFFGDYNNISAYNNVVRPIWTRLHNAQLSVWTAIIDSNFVGIDMDPMVASDDNEPIYPNPAQNLFYLPFKVHQPLQATLVLYNMEGKLVAKIFEDKTFETGKYIEPVHLQGYSLSPGIYLLALDSPEHHMLQKVVIQ